MIQHIQYLLKYGCLIKHPIWSLLSPCSKIGMQPTTNVKQEINWWHIPFSHSLYSSPQAGNIVCQEPLRKSRSVSKMQCSFLNSHNLECNVQYSCVHILPAQFTLFIIIFFFSVICIFIQCSLIYLMPVWFTSVMCYEYDVYMFNICYVFLYCHK